MASMKKMEPGDDQVHVWIISGRNRLHYDPGMSLLLSADERARARRFHDRGHAAQWTFFHACCRDILGACTGRAPASLVFEPGEHQKPCLKESTPAPTYFNLSHSGELALLAVTRRAPVGVDVELVRELRDQDALVKRFFSAAEQADFAKLSADDRVAAFYSIWTRKEALIKANGIGLSAPLHAFDVPLSSISNWHLPAVRAPLPPDTAYPVRHIDPGAGYIGALALELPPAECDVLPQVQLHQYLPEFQ
jgi:4'-phosphopantetheinyl transferase